MFGEIRRADIHSVGIHSVAQPPHLLRQSSRTTDLDFYPVLKVYTFPWLQITIVYSVLKM